MLWLLSGPPGFTCWISFAPVFSFVYCWVLILALPPFYILIYMLKNVPGDDALIRKGYFMQTKHLFVLIHIWTKGEVGAPWKRLKPSSKIFYRPFQGGASIVDHFWYFCLVFCYAFVRICILMPCGHLLGKGWPLGSRLWCLIAKLSFFYWYSGSSVVNDCIESWSLPSFSLKHVCKQSRPRPGSSCCCLNTVYYVCLWKWIDMTLH